MTNKQCDVYIATDQAFLKALRNLLNNGEITIDQYCASLRRIHNKDKVVTQKDGDRNGIQEHDF